MDLAVKELKELKRFDQMKTVEYNTKLSEAESKMAQMEEQLKLKDDMLS